MLNCPLNLKFSQFEGKSLLRKNWDPPVKIIWFRLLNLALSLIFCWLWINCDFDLSLFGLTGPTCMMFPEWENEQNFVSVKAKMSTEIIFLMKAMPVCETFLNWCWSTWETRCTPFLHPSPVSIFQTGREYGVLKASPKIPFRVHGFSGPSRILSTFCWKSLDQSITKLFCSVPIKLK